MIEAAEGGGGGGEDKREVLAWDAHELGIKVSLRCAVTSPEWCYDTSLSRALTSTELSSQKTGAETPSVIASSDHMWFGRASTPSTGGSSNLELVVVLESSRSKVLINMCRVLSNARIIEVYHCNLDKTISSRVYLCTCRGTGVQYCRGSDTDPARVVDSSNRSGTGQSMVSYLYQHEVPIDSLNSLPPGSSLLIKFLSLKTVSEAMPTALYEVLLGCPPVKDNNGSSLSPCWVSKLELGITNRGRQDNENNRRDSSGPQLRVTPTAPDPGAAVAVALLEHSIASNSYTSNLRPGSIDSAAPTMPISMLPMAFASFDSASGSVNSDSRHFQATSAPDHPQKMEPVSFAGIDNNKLCGNRDMEGSRDEKDTQAPSFMQQTFLVNIQQTLLEGMGKLLDERLSPINQRLCDIESRLGYIEKCLTANYGANKIS